MKLLVSDKNQDLHIHTRCSDGAYLVEQIVNLAADSAPITISITDHNTMAAYKNLDKKMLKGMGVNVIFGVEMTCLFYGRKIDLLGYGIDYRMFELLKHVYYKKYPGHMNKYITAINAKRLIHILGGKLILAHPYKYTRGLNGMALVKEVMRDNLIDGIECFHSYHTKEETEKLLEYAIKNDLYVTAGSDCHSLFNNVRFDKTLESLATLPVLDKDIKGALEYYKNFKELNKK